MGQNTPDHPLKNPRFRDAFADMLASQSDDTQAKAVLAAAEQRANALAARLLAAQSCPVDLIEWGNLHRIPTFAEFTWQAGFLAGLRAAALGKMEVEG